MAIVDRPKTTGVEQNYEPELPRDREREIGDFASPPAECGMSGGGRGRKALSSCLLRIVLASNNAIRLASSRRDCEATRRRHIEIGKYSIRPVSISIPRFTALRATAVRFIPRSSSAKNRGDAASAERKSDSLREAAHLPVIRSETRSLFR